MKQTILKLLLFINSILLIAYMGLTAHADLHLNTRGVIPLFLSSLLLIDVTYVSSCNIRENRLFRGDGGVKIPSTPVFIRLSDI